MRAARLFWGGISVVLLSAAVWPWLPGEQQRSETEASNAQTYPVTTASEGVGSVPSYTETLQRPLFRATRRPPAPAAEPPKPSAPTPQLVGYRLTGIVETGARRMILLESPAGKSMQLFEGESVDGWTVETIGDNAVILATGTTRINLLDSRDATETAPGGRNTRWLPAGGARK